MGKSEHPLESFHHAIGEGILKPVREAVNVVIRNTSKTRRDSSRRSEYSFYMRFRLTVFALATFGLVPGRTADVLAGCAPGCKICLLDVCSDGPQRGTGAKDVPLPPRPRTAPSAPISDDPLVNRENELKGLKPTDISSVDEWTGEVVGFSKRDFALTMLQFFVAAGNCIAVSDLRNEIEQLSGGYGEGSRWLDDSLAGDSKYSFAARKSQYERDRQVAQAIAAKAGETLQGLSRENIVHIVQHYQDVTDWKYTAPWLARDIREWRGANREKEPKLKQKLQEAEAGLYKSYDCRKEGWWR